MFGISVPNLGDFSQLNSGGALALMRIRLADRRPDDAVGVGLAFQLYCVLNLSHQGICSVVLMSMRVCARRPGA